jgi:hypothetical protein
MDWQYHTKRKGQVRLSKIKGDVCMYLWLYVTACDYTGCWKKWWRSSRVCSTQTRSYMSNLTALADLHRKKEPLLRTAEEVDGPQSWSGCFGQKKKKNLFFPRGSNLRFLSRPAPYAVTETTEISGSISLFMHVKPSRHLRGFVLTDMHSIPYAEIAQRTAKVCEDRDLTDLVQLLCTSQATTATSCCSRTAIDWQFSDKGAELQQTRPPPPPPPPPSQTTILF